ncbi:MAG: hypothetical protein WC314_19375 [Vulcanimicrobiota bacterium]
MSNTQVAYNEKRFRRGSLLLLFLSALSAASTAALYYGFDIPVFYTTSLAVPVVTDIALKTFFAGWIWMEKVRYYWFLGSLVLAAVLGGIALMSTGISLSGHALSASFSKKRVNKVFSALGIAQLMSARALSAFGLLFYLLDGVVSVALVLAWPQTFTPYYLFLMGNLLLHLVALTFLGYSFSARVGGGAEDQSVVAPGPGEPV